jgi:BolA protein
MIKEIIETKLSEAFSPVHFQVINESYMHAVPDGSESHFKVVVVSEAFSDKRLVARHRLVNSVLADELSHHIHALSINVFTPEEWLSANGEFPASPNCLGKGQ